MKKQLFLLLALNLFGIGLFAQNLAWASSAGGTNPDEGFSIVTDASGNIYTTGNFHGTVDFDPGAGIINLTSAGITDIFISKTSPAGNLIWVRSIGSTDYDYGNAITVDGSGNVFVTGYFNFTVDFDPGAGVFNLVSSGTNDAYVLKLDNSGNFVWAKRLGSGSGDEGLSIVTDATGNVYTSGTFYGTVDFDPSASVFNLSSGSNSGAFILKLDNSGNFVFAKNFNGFLSEGRGLTLDASGNIYATGNYNGTVDFDPGAGVVNLTSVGADDIFIAKLNSLGNFVWAKSAGSSTWDYGYSINVDGSGNVYTSGTYGGTTDFDPGAGVANLSNAGQNDVFVLKLDVSGNYVWAVSFGGTGGDYGFTSKLDGFGNIYAAGSFEGTVDFNPGAGVNNLVSNGNDDAFLVKLDAGGNYLWAQGLGAAIYDRYRGITVDAANNVITTGSFFNTVDFDPNAPVVNLTSLGSSDIFISKISCLPGLAGAISGPPAMCQGGASANYSIPPVAGATGYSWTVPAGAIINSGQNTSSINVTIGASSGMVVVTPTNSCGSSPSVSLSITSATSPTITSSASPNFVCSGGTSTLSASGPLLLDQQSTSGVSTGFWIATASGQQSFIAGLNGVLKKVRVHTATYGSAATITLKVYSGPVGGGSLLTTVSYGKGTNINSWDDVMLPAGGVSVSAGSPYYIEIVSGSQIDWIYRNINVYANGQAWRGGISYTYDYNFETYIDQNTYLWNPGAAPTQNFIVSPPSTTNYTVTVTNAAGCANTQQVLLNVNPIMNAATVITNVSCNGGSNGAIDLIPSGGTPPYTYVWSNSQITQDIINLFPGSYNVTITDANGCTKPASGVVTQPSLLNASSAITTSINCNGGTGVVSVSGSGGTPPYSGTGSFTVSAGTYTYNVTDANGCLKTTTITVTQPTPLIVNVNASSTICSGGIANLSASGASTYTWNPGGLTGANVGVTPFSTTTYTVTGTSAIGCVGTNTTMVTVNPNPTVTVSSSTICIGATANLTASGANTYSWNTGATTSAITVSPGSTTNYTVTGTNTFGCTNTKTTSVTVNLLPTITTTASPASICVGSNANLIASGATTYTWNPGGLTGSAVTVSPASTTVYTVTGTNSNGCVNTQTINLTVNNLPVVTAAASPTTMCAGATATLTATGGSTYTWSPGGATTQTLTVSPASNTIYTVTATNAVGCINTQTVNLNVNPAFTTAISFTNVTCNGGNDGAINLTVTGGLPPHTYLWSNSQTTEDIINQPAGVYNVTVTDMIGCTTVTGATITQPALLIAGSAVTTSINCNGGTGVVSVSGSGGVPPYIGTGSFTVAAGTYTYNVTDANGCLKTTTINVSQPAPLTITVSASSSICAGATTTLTAAGASTYTWNPGGLTGASVGVTPGTTTVYTATGTSSLGCVATNTTSVTVNPNPTVTVSSSTICVGGTATLTASGAVTYSWNTGATTASITVSPSSNTNYTVTGTNGFGCVNTKSTSVTVNLLPAITAVVSPTAICAGSTATLTGTGATTYTWNPGALTGSVKVVSPGSTTIYTVTGTNSNGCINTQTVSLTVNSLPTLTIAATPTVICVGATSTLTGTGATTYTWNPGALIGASVSVSPSSTTQYTVTGTNSNGCVNTQTLSLTVNPLPTLTIAASPATICVGATSTLTGAGATTYTWNPGALTGPNVVISPASTTVYTLAGTNGNGCVNTKTLNVTVNPLPTLTVAASPATICVGGTATLTSTGATTYTWNPGALTGSVTVVSPGASTIYTVTGTNGNGCINTQTVGLTVNLNPVITTVLSSTAICAGETATITGSGATTYTWNPGGLTGSVINVNPASSTIYTVTGENGSGCAQTETISLIVIALPVVTAASSASAICAGETATLTAGGAITYLWDSGASTSVITVTPTTLTVYTVTGTDGNNCVNSETVSITVNALPVMTAMSSSTVICAGATATLTGTGATSYTWNPGVLIGSTISVSPPSSTIYTVTGANGSGCVQTETVSLIVNALPVVTANSTSSAICSGQSVTLNGSGALSYAWDNGVVDGIGFQPSVSAAYIVTGTDVNGCVGTDTTFVTVNSLPVIVANTTSTAVCSGDFVSLTGSGALTYTWNPGALTGDTVTVNPSSNTNYTLSGTDGAGCVNTETISLTVNPLPVVTATASSAGICVGATATLSAAGAVSYTWTPGMITGAVTAVSPTSTTVYTVTGIDGSGCVNTASLGLSVSTNPTVTAVSSSSFICSGASVTLIGSGANSYTWNPGSISSASVSVSPTSTTTYTLTGENATGCVNTETLTVAVGSLPAVTASGSSSVICAGATATLTASGANSYTWNPGGGIGASVGVSAASSTVYTVTGTDVNGCMNTNTFSLAVNALPVVLISPSNPTVCSGQSVVLTASGANTYTWSGSGSNLNPNTVSPVSSTTYSVIGTDINGCESSASTFVNVVSAPVMSINTPSTSVCFGYTMTVVASGATNYLWSNGAATNSTVIQPFSNSTYSVIGNNGGSCSDTAYLSITVLPLPTVSASASTSLACTGQTITLNASGNAVNYLWQPNNLVGASQNVQINAQTTYTVYGQGSNGCAFFSTVNVDVQNGNSVTPITTPGIICIGDSAVLSVLGGSVSSWSNNPSPNTFVVAPITGTTYTYTATDFNGCSSDISFMVAINIGCDIVVYNGFTPNGDGINDSWLIDNIDKYPNNKVYIYNRWGTKIFETINYNNKDNNWDGKFNGNVVDSGTYFYIILDESDKLLRKGWIEITN